MAILAGQRIRALDWAGYASGFDGTNITGLAPTLNTWITPSPVFGVSFMAPSSGAVKCDFNGRINIATGGDMAYAACQLRTGNVINSGTVVEDPSLERAIETGAFTGVPNSRLGAGSFRIHTGLTPGALYHFVWQCGRENSAGNLTVYARAIAVTPWQG
jgi:hypothetical protein